ncbi:uncharacterized protein BDW70DRAFT_139431 [Aspergillus foveolatus]|uniref:uncharacterized protein n=1 Tax=Aspergillus foveolatus TaxID=210207 RepID=UPI003CCCA81B
MPCYPMVAPFQHSTVQSPLFAPSATASPTGHLDDGEIEALITVALLKPHAHCPLPDRQLWSFWLMRTAMPSIWAFPGSSWTLNHSLVDSVISNYRSHTPLLELGS